MNGDTLAGYGLRQVLTRPSSASAYLVYQQGQPSRGGLFAHLAGPRWRRLLDLRLMQLLWATLPAQFIRPPTVGNGAASQDLSLRGTNCVIRVSRTSGHDRSCVGYDAAVSKSVAAEAIFPRYRSAFYG